MEASQICCLLKDRIIERKKKRPILSRLFNKIKYEIWELFTTVDTLEEKIILEAPKYFSDFNIALIGVFKRAVFVSLFVYFAINIYQNTTEKQQFIGADIESGNCESIVKISNGMRIAAKWILDGTS